MLSAPAALSTDGRPQRPIESRLEMSRRSFLQFCATLATTLGLPKGAEAAMAQAMEAAQRPSVIWLHFQECTGCTESMLRAEHPTLEKLILDVISLDYHETLFAAAGHQVEAARKAAMERHKGKYLLVVEGAIPTRDGGIYCKVGNQTAIELTRECAKDAAAVIAIGSCASWGGMPATDPNPTGAGTWPVGCGHPCIGCTEEGVGFSKPIHMLAKVKNVEPPALYPAIHEPQGQGATLGSAAVLAAVAGAAAGAGAMFARNLGKQHAADTAAKPAQREDA